MIFGLVTGEGVMGMTPNKSDWWHLELNSGFRGISSGC